MKKFGILNSDISKVLSDLGHTDLIAIGDIGLPIPSSVKKIDLSLKLGVPGFVDVLEEVVLNMQIDKAYLANEIIEKNNSLYTELKEKYSSTFSVDFISHEELKEKLKNVKAVIRTGEATPYANIILEAGVIF